MSTTEKGFHWTPAIRVSVLTSVFALLAAISTVLTGRSGNRSIILKNDVVYYQGLVTDDWAFFQSRKMRSEIAELLKLVKSGLNEHKELEMKIAEFDREAEEIKAQAKAHEQLRDSFNAKTNSYLFLFKYFALTQVLFQISILLLPLSLLTKQKPLEIMGCAMGVAGVFALFYSSFHYFQTIGM